ncbi:hypothetical protein TMatcc_006830 [Talaromyces marneffei ATCC 18224]|uniref:Rhodopsin domain-containing protein n=1 Tax=Talaromyces marneffei (strain ATCC 18224 / CBS 334.59 / QM 7333) TaxID=441960 RepID=B6QDA7_TALMQ|nr:conserved hypothetical protein [Talaromyces marneffei ATCC 18224]KAE8553717.1 hypothetical protein EYB25_005099 [Talaromyces marneffei]
MSYTIFPRQTIDLNGPTIPPPGGSVSNLDNPPNGNHIAIPIITLCAVISAISYLIRFYAKYVMKKVNASDYLTVVAFPLYWVYIYYSYHLSETSGYLVHEWDIRLKDITAFSYICWLATLLYLWIIALVKCAIMLEWTRIFAPEGTNTYLSRSWYATGAAISLLSIILFIMDLVNCTPFSGNWDVLVAGRHCRFSVPAFGLASSIVNLTLEIIPLVLVQKVIWGLHMSWKKKLGVSLIFFIGIIGCAASTVRLYYATQFYVSNDTSYFFSIMALCSLSETTCANLILCVPCTPKAIKGFKQTQSFTTLRSYTTLRSRPTTTSATTVRSEPTFEVHVTNEIDSVSKPNDSWIMMTSRGSRRDSAYSGDSDRHHLV